MADLCMHVVGEVERRRVCCEFDDVALRTNGVDAVFEHVVANLVEDIVAFADGVDELSQETNFLVKRGRRTATFFVSPVRGDAKLGLLVHLVGANLNFKCLAVGPDDCSVQRSVVVVFWIGNVVVELSWQVRPELMHDAECRVAVRNVVNEDPHGANVVKTVEAAILALHFSPDAVDVLGPSRD